MKSQKLRFVICIVIISTMACVSANATVDYLKKYKSVFSNEAITAAKNVVPLEKMADAKLEIYRFCYAAGYDAALGNSPSTSTQSYTPIRSQVSNPTTHTYILNKSTKKFHEPSCSHAKKISDKNRVTFNGTREEAIRKGYDPCKVCNP